MTPNFEHFRTILLELQSLDNPSQFRGIAEIPNEETNGYLHLLEDKGLIEGNFFQNKHDGQYIVSRITLKGYEFLEGISDESKWQEAKKSVSVSSTLGNSANLATLIDFILRYMQ